MREYNVQNPKVLYLWIFFFSFSYGLRAYKLNHSLEIYINKRDELFCVRKYFKRTCGIRYAKDVET